MTSDWRDHVMNARDGQKTIPRLVTPGGQVHYRRCKLPQLSAPELLAVDYPFIRIDNYLIRFYPIMRREMAWLSESTARWSRERRCPEYRRTLNDFVESIETACRTQPLGHQWL